VILLLIAMPLFAAMLYSFPRDGISIKVDQVAGWGVKLSGVPGLKEKYQILKNYNFKLHDDCEFLIKI
jgi:hypothetical protein